MRVYDPTGGVTQHALPAAASGLVLSGLENGETYGVEVAAVNTAGEGVRSSYIRLTPAAPPAAPGDVDGEGLDGGALLHWTSGAYSGSPVANWTVEGALADAARDGSAAMVHAVGGGNATRLAVSGLQVRAQLRA